MAMILRRRAALCMLAGIAVDAFAVASHTSGGVSRLFLYDRTLGAQLAMLEVAAAWTEGPGLVSRPDKHGIPGTRCGDVPIDVMRSVGPEGPSTWDLAHVGYDMSSGLGCECLDLGRVYEGSLLVSAGLPLTMVRGGVRLQFALEAPARRLARSSYSVTSEMFHAIPYGASMHAGDEVLGAPGRPAAFHLDDDRLWPASCLELITDNGSSISSVTVEQFDAIPIANSLYCLQ